MKIIITLLLSLFALSSCVKEPEYSGDKLEARSLRAWIKKNRPELLGNFQSKGEYYVDVLEWGEIDTPAKDNDRGSEPIMDQDTCWVYYNFNCYDLDGNLCSTRKEVLARMQATYSDRTHYVPYANYCGEAEYYAIVEGSYLATRNKLTLSEEYVASKPNICRGTEFVMRKGSKVRLYMTSTIGFGSSGSSSEGGYEGQSSLDTNVPLVMDIEVVRVVKNPSDTELEMVDALVKDSNANSEDTVWLQIENKEDKEEGEDEVDENSDESNKENSEEVKYYDGIYYTTKFTPTEEFAHFKHARPDMAGIGNPYTDTKRFSNMAEFDKKLWKILNDKFADQIKNTSNDKATVIGDDNYAMVWYVGRFLDGFIFDTNIDEVRELAFNETDEGGEAISYSKSSDEDEYISAWAHCIPKLKYGRWGAIITTSGYAYGSTGVSGSTSSSSSSSYSYYNMLNYYNYYNYYSSYYNPYSYYNYYNYYGGYNNYYNSYEETTSTIETEIMPYTPLIFYIFIEPQED